jgi:hypothetical protein
MRPVRSSPDNNNLRGNSMKTHGSASWKGGVRDGKGAISTKSSALSLPAARWRQRGAPAPALIMPQARNTATAARLWDVSEQLAETSFN